MALALLILFIEKFADDWLCPSRKLQDATDVNIANKMAACTGPYMRSSGGRQPVYGSLTTFFFRKCLGD